MFFACWNPVQVSFFHTQSYLYMRKFPERSFVEKGSDPNRAITPGNLRTRLYCAQSLSSGSTLSHLHSVDPYGRSHSIRSTYPSGMSAINSRQSPFSSFIDGKSLVSLCISPLFVVLIPGGGVVVIIRYLLSAQHLQKLTAPQCPI